MNVKNVFMVWWCFLLGGASFGQPAQPPTQTFSDVVDVRVVNLEVVVTNRKGERISGLDAGAFELRIDGEVVPIEYFTEIRDGLTVPGPEGEPGRAVPSLVGVGALRTNFLVFIDEYFSIRRDRDRLLDLLVPQIEGLGPDDRMAIVRYDGRDLEMLTTWSRDRAELRSAIARAKGHASGGLQRLAELRQRDLSARRGDLRVGVSGFGQLGVEERYYVSRITDQVERVVTAAVSTMRGFAAPPGRKVMLLLSGGWPYDPAEYVVDNPARPITESLIRRGPDLYSALTDTANLLGYTLYPIDVPGLQGSSIDAESDLVGTSFGPLGGRSFYRETGLQNTLYHLASETGGVAMINRGRDKLLTTAIEDTRSFYWLGYSPQRQGDDRRHRIEIRVLRAGLKVRGREDYFDFSRQKEVTLAVESALYFGTPASSQPLSVRIGRAKRAGLKTMKVPVTVGIPAEAITLLPGPGGLIAQLELRIAVLDESGSTADTPVIPLSLTLEKRPEPGTMLHYETALKMRRKPHDLVIAIYDLVSGTILSTSVEVAPQ